jgi:hypothetical protein
LKQSAANVPAFKMPYNLQQELDAFVDGERSALAFASGLSDLCRVKPEAAWVALSLIDQYHRRGKLSVEMYRMLSHGIERQLLGTQRSGAIDVVASKTVGSADTDATVPGMAVQLEIQRRARKAGEGAVNVLALNTELVRARGQVQRYRNCLAMLARFDRKNRSALTAALHDLKLSRTQAADYLEQLSGGVSRRYVAASSADRSHPATDFGDERQRRWQMHSSLAVSLAALLLVVGASPVR